MTLEEYFNELFAYMLSIGMNEHQFWEESPFLIIPYIEAEKIRQKKRNNEMWIQGAYIQQAVASCLSKNAKYPREPIPLSEEEQEEARNRRALAFKQKLIAISKKN